MRPFLLAALSGLLAISSHNAFAECYVCDDLVVLVGGAPLNEEFGKAVGADAYCRDAAVAVETAKEFMKRKHNSHVTA